ncbi:MAG: D-alanine--D-alanine ligase [Thiovulaceae bacterium]|nr:D-alanine--D-alanine ligase [Sulfurimonadaceae bacterium]
MQGIIFGGKSFEHEISIVSAITVSKKIAKVSHFIFLDAGHNFYLIPKEKMIAKTFSSGAYKKMPQLSPIQGGFAYGFLNRKKLVGIQWINIVHGGDGEDGVLASLFAFYGIDFIGPRPAASAVSFDKYLTKMYAKELGVKVVDYALVRKGEAVNLPFDYPVIVKPLTLGSSIGVSIVKEKSGMDYALDTAFEYDDQALIEPFIVGVKEYNLAGALVGDTWELSMIEEPQKEEFLDFDKKYLDFSRTGNANKAEILDKIALDIQEAFKKIYNVYFQGALIRCDFFVIDNEVYLNEINPIPGSLSNYLFDNFSKVLGDLSKKTPQAKEIRVNYHYIDKIHASKGK